MNKPKPCPFCMSDSLRVGEGEYRIFADQLMYKSYIVCSECKAMIMRASDESLEHARKAAFEAWNRRAHGGTAYMEGT